MTQQKNGLKNQDTSESVVRFRPAPDNAPIWNISSAPRSHALSNSTVLNLGCDNSGGCCVMAGTLVLLEDGSHKTIETFTGGERVVTMNGIATVKGLESVKLGVTRRMIELDGGDGDPLYITDDHSLWTKFADDTQYWTTYNYNHFLFTKEAGLSSTVLSRDPKAIRFDIPHQHAHISGWKELRPVYCNLPIETPVYQLELDGGSYIANGFVVICHCRDEDVAIASWDGLENAPKTDVPESVEIA